MVWHIETAYHLEAVPKLFQGCEKGPHHFRRFGAGRKHNDERMQDDPLETEKHPKEMARKPGQLRSERKKRASKGVGTEEGIDPREDLHVLSDR